METLDARSAFDMKRPPLRCGRGYVLPASRIDPTGRHTAGEECVASSVARGAGRSAAHAT